MIKKQLNHVSVFNGYQYSAKLDEDRKHAKEQVEEENNKREDVKTYEYKKRLVIPHTKIFFKVKRQGQD